MNPDINGLWPALLIPLNAKGELNEVALLAHAKNMLLAGCDGVTLFGTTGEGPAFSVAQRNDTLDLFLANGIKPQQCLVTITALAQADAIELGRHASKRGVHRQMYLPPFYFKQPNDSGVLAAVTQVIQGIDDAQLKLLLYHFPAISTYAFSHAAIAELVRRFPGQVVGVKDSSGDLAHSLALAKAFPELSILVGAEQYVAQVMQAGGSGSINGLSNIAPRLLRRMINNPGQVSESDHQLVIDLLALLSIRPNMSFVSTYKAMMAEQTGDDGWLSVCPPLSPLSSLELQAVKQVYRDIGKQLKFI